MIEINEKERSMEFDMIGIDASVANAFRRILLSEVKFTLTLKIRKVEICRGRGDRRSTQRGSTVNFHFCRERQSPMLIARGG